MGLPAIFKTYAAPVTVTNALHGNARDNAKDIQFQVATSFLALGWKTKGSCNASAYGNGDGVQRINAYTDWVANSGANTKSWWVLENGVGAQLCIQYADVGGGTDYASFTWAYSPDGGFGGGDTHTMPTATHGVTCYLSTPAPFGSGGGGHGNEAYTARIVASTDAAVTRVMWWAGSRAFAFWAFDVARSPKSGWASPNYFINDFVEGLNSANQIGGKLDRMQNGPGVAVIYGYANGNVVGANVGQAHMFPLTMAMGTQWPNNVTTVNGLTGLYDVEPVTLGVPATTTPAVRGKYGLAPDLLIIPKLTDGSATQKFTSGSTTPLSGTMLWITFGDLLLPWGGGAVSGDVGDFDSLDCPCPVPAAPSSALVDPAVSAQSTGIDSEGFGIDVDAIVDVPLRWGLVAGRRNLGDAIARRLIFLRSLLNAGMSDAQISTCRAQAIAAVEADERIQRVTIFSFVLNRSTATLTVTVEAETAAGPFATVFDLQLAGSTS